MAVDGDAEGRAALAIWSDFVLAAQRQTTAACEDGRQQARDCTDDGAGGSIDAALRGEEREERKLQEGREAEGNKDLEFPRFPAVWIITSDRWIDRAVRECMPHLLPCFVPGAFGGDREEGPRTQGEVSSWSHVLDRFLSENPDVDVFGIFGERALPTAALLPFPPKSFVATSDAGAARARPSTTDSGGCSGGCAIETFLWPVLSKSNSPMAVISRARAWWKEDGAESGAGRVTVDEWMPDRFVAQVM